MTQQQLPSAVHDAAHALTALERTMARVRREYGEFDRGKPMAMAYALGRMHSIKEAADTIAPGQSVVLLPEFWQRDVDRLGV